MTRDQFKCDNTIKMITPAIISKVTPTDRKNIYIISICHPYEKEIVKVGKQNVEQLKVFKSFTKRFNTISEACAFGKTEREKLKDKIKIEPIPESKYHRGNATGTIKVQS